MKKLLFFLFALFLFSPFTFLFAQTPENLALQANQAYQKGNYALCITLLDSLHHQQLGSAATFYNEGNAYYQLKNYPQAILNYERALRLDAGDKDARNNLNLANKQLSDNISPLPEFFLFRGWKAFSRLAMPTFWAIFALVCLIGGLVVAVSHRITPRKSKIKAIAILLFFAIVGRFAYLSRYEQLYQNETAIILVNEVELQAKPGKENALVRKVIGGIKVEIKEELGDWANVKLPNGESGWLETKNIERIYTKGE